MSKYERLWEYLKNSDALYLEMTFDDIENIVGIPIDHSFLKYKKELLDYGWTVKKISLKKSVIIFEKLN